MDEQDREFHEFLASERRRALPAFIFWMVVILASFIGVLAFSYYVPHLIFR